MRYFIILLMPILLLASNPLKHLTKKQKYVMVKTFIKAKQFDLQYTMTAIAWQESEFGKYQINLVDPSCGTFHIMPKYVKGVDNKWEESRMCERLVSDYDFSFAVALERFKYFYNYWKSKGYSNRIAWQRAIMSYNAGFNYKNGFKYYKQIVRKIYWLRKYFERK